MEHHPDNGGSEDIIKEVNAEYDILVLEYKQYKLNMADFKNSCIIETDTGGDFP